MNIYVDGSIRKNGKEGAFGGVGVVAFYKDKCVLKYSQLIKSATNNESEYSAVIAGIALGNKLKKNYVIYSDSELVVKQIKGEYRVDKDSLKELHHKAYMATSLSGYFISIDWIPREQNKEADKLAQGITKEAL